MNKIKGMYIMLQQGAQAIVSGLALLTESSLALKTEDGADLLTEG